MFKIVIVGDDAKNTLTKSVCLACSAYGKLIHENRSFTHAKFCILNDINIEKGEDCDIAVFGECLNLDIHVPKANFCILDSGNKNAAHLIYNTGLTAITCSMAAYDTLTADAVVEKENILISLRRDIVMPNGTTIEPQDFRLHLKNNMPIYHMLASCGVLILCGVSGQNGYVF